jgi:hypothetical protein
MVVQWFKFQKLILFFMVISWSCETKQESVLGDSPRSLLDSGTASISIISTMNIKDLESEVTEINHSDFNIKDQYMNRDIYIQTHLDAEFNIMNDSCIDGTYRSCFTKCEIGIERCVNTQWSPCSAKQPSVEICDGLDNDCNGDIDDLATIPSHQRCLFGSIDEELSCGLCSTQARSCTACQWSDWSECNNIIGAECTPNDIEQNSCGVTLGQCREGQQFRTCDESCQWSNWGNCENEVTPSPEICGNLIDEDCDGDVLREFDFYEFNDSCANCTMLTSRYPFNAQLYATIDSVNDVDYYCFNLVDRSSNIFIRNESLSIHLLNIPIGQNYDVHVYRSNENCINDERLASSMGTGNSEFIQLNREFHHSRDESDLYYIKVFPTSGYECGDSYALTINWSE